MDRKVSERDIVGRHKKRGNVVITVKEQADANSLEEYLVYIKKNGEEARLGSGYIGKDDESDYPIDRTPIGRGGFQEEPEEETPAEGTPGWGFPGGETPRGGFKEKEPEEDEPEWPAGGEISDGDTPEDDEPDSTSNDEKAKDEKSLGKWTRRGGLFGLALLLLVAIANIKQERYDINEFSSDRNSVKEISDLDLIGIDGQYIHYAGSVYSDPGKLIRDVRGVALGEGLQSEAGRKAYIENRTPEELNAEKEETFEITRLFQEQQGIISENESILRDENSSDEEKKQALEKILEAKDTMQNIYKDNLGLYDKYARLADNASRMQGGDGNIYANVEFDDRNLGESEYTLAIKDFELDKANLTMCINILNNPSVLYTNPPAR